MKITIHNLGPIKDCVIEPSNFTVLMGEQASGKSTIAKCVFFFSTVKDDICDALLKKQSLNPEELKDILKNKFKRLFGVNITNYQDMKLKCVYSKGTSIELMFNSIKLTDYNEIYISYLNNKLIDIANDIERLMILYPFLDKSKNKQKHNKFNKYYLNNTNNNESTGEEKLSKLKEQKKQIEKTIEKINHTEKIINDIEKVIYDKTNEIKIIFKEIEELLNQKDLKKDKVELQKQLDVFFHDEYSTVFIPAGRCLVSQLSQQLSYLYSSMGDELKYSLDYTTQKFIETVFFCRMALQNGIEGLQSLSSSQWKEDIAKLLKGRYVCTAEGEERLYLSDEPQDNGKYVLFHLASSGQQELAWLLNIVAYYLDAYNRTGSKTMFIIEEPETHLYPTAQKELMDILAFVANQSQSFFITTHSPYVLGSLNNLLYAGSRPARLKKKIANIIPQEYQLKHIDAFYLKDGKMKVAIDQDMEPLVQNGLIDDASHELNNEFDRMIDLQYLKEK